MEYPDIVATMKKIGGAPTSKTPDGRDKYTLPAIHDSATGEVVTDSIRIAEYLDNTYPNPLQAPLFPIGGRGAVYLYDNFFMQTVFPTLIPIVLPAACIAFNPPSEDYLRKSLEPMLGAKMEELSPPGQKRDADWHKVREAFGKLAEIYDKNGRSKYFFFGDSFSYADAIVVGFLAWIRVALGASSREWLAVTKWDGGRWGALHTWTEEYQKVLY